MREELKSKMKYYLGVSLKERINAKMARHLADSSHSTLDKVYDMIHCHAEQNFVHCDFDIKDLSDDAVDTILMYLHSDGFTTEVKKDNLYISW